MNTLNDYLTPASSLIKYMAKVYISYTRHLDEENTAVIHLFSQELLSGKI